MSTSRRLLTVFIASHYGKSSNCMVIQINSTSSNLCTTVLHSNCCVKTRDGLTCLFDVITGVRQGCILSPLLFLICIDYVMRKALNHPEFGIPWGRGKLTDLDFADDVAVLSHSATTLQQMTDSLKTSAEMVGLRISSDKTKVSTVSATDTPISIGQQTLEGVSEFQYLVSIISTNLDVEVDIRAKIGKAASTFQRLCKIWSSHSINLDTKLRLYMSIVIPTALHACETWKSTSIIRQKLHVFHQRCLRTILGISWRDHITNDEVLRRVDLGSLSEIVRQRRLRFTSAGNELETGHELET